VSGVLFSECALEKICLEHLPNGTKKWRLADAKTIQISIHSGPDDGVGVRSARAAPAFDESGHEWFDHDEYAASPTRATDRQS
jgi:hypothetical protein